MLFEEATIIFDSGKVALLAIVVYLGDADQVGQEGLKIGDTPAKVHGLVKSSDDGLVSRDGLSNRGC